MRILPSKERLEVSKKLEPYTYYDEDFNYCLKENVPDEAKELWGKFLKFKEEEKEQLLQEWLM